MRQLVKCKLRKPMKIIHLADTHLGYSAYRKVSERGFNQREEDINAAFIQAIDKIIELKPEIVLHCGDLFDAVRPSNRILHLALSQILRLIQAKIKVIIISGNHDTPKQRYLGSVFSIFEVLPIQSNQLWIAHKGCYEKIGLDGMTIHALPQCPSPEQFEQELAKITLDPNTKNILMLHAGTKGMQEFSHGDFNELLIDSRYLEKPFDYIALGHYHGQVQVGKGAYYSGSTERLSFNEVNRAKGFLEINLDQGSRPVFHELKIRPMIEIPFINAQGLDSIALMAAIEKGIQSIDPQGKIARAKATNISSDVYGSLDFKKISAWTSAATHFELIFEKADENIKTESMGTAIRGLREEYLSYINNLADLDEEKKKELINSGLSYLNQVME